MGHQTHGLFLHLISHVDNNLSTRLHDEPGYRPFTVSALSGADKRQNSLILRQGHTYRLRVTLLDGGQIWQCLSEYFLGTGMKQNLKLGEVEFSLQKIHSTAESDPSGWAAHTDWHTLTQSETQTSISIQFASPTAFSLGDRRYALYPEPILLWDSLMRSWNLYAPQELILDKPPIREFIKQHVMISDYSLQTETLHYPKHTQKGFVGHCTYSIKTLDGYASQLASLAQFARYSGIGYRTPMGMGQARVIPR
jgi:CRISPR-associated endoribonuclease Cas6